MLAKNKNPTLRMWGKNRTVYNGKPRESMQRTGYSEHSDRCGKQNRKGEERNGKRHIKRGQGSRGPGFET